MRKTRELFKKSRDTKETFHAKMGSIKDRNGRDLTEAEDIMKRWQEYTENCTKKIFTTQLITIAGVQPQWIQCNSKRGQSRCPRKKLI